MTTSSLTRRSLSCAVTVLVLIGVVAAIGRALYPGDMTTRGQELRPAILRALGQDDPYVARRPAEVARIDQRYGDHRFATYVHVIAGGLFLLLAPFQFSRKIRARHIHFHRWSGRLLVVSGLATTLAGFYFGLTMPYAGFGEALVVAPVGLFFLFSLAKAVMAIRKRDVPRHRVWMIRAFGVAVGISMSRVVGAAADTLLTTRGFTLPDMFVLSLWAGFAITMTAAELWIRRTRDGEVHRDARLSVAAATAPQS